MTEREHEHGHPRTTPSEAVGESGDREARQEAEEAVVRRSDAGDTEDAGGHAAKRQRTGTGREEQTRPHQGRGTGASRESGEG
ncbi:hypothetical protein ABZZ17_07130 [Streptomyces sp. NPDC006512]|uniref:hypothetical protein n=1 Tax=Streptomyces sp. NPDC006512 TaxID=3154307 RepID=UPI0033A722F6